MDGEEPLSARLTVRLFGGFEAHLGSGEGLRLPTKKAQALLAYLSLRPGRNHSRDVLASVMWGEQRDDRARDGLRHALAALRKALADSGTRCLRAAGHTLSLDPEEVDVDVAAFERHVLEGTPAALERAAEIYRGDLLLGFSLREPLFEEWLIAERERLREMALEALARLLASQVRAAETERAIRTAVRLLALDPLQEAVHRALMRLYDRQGRRGAALKQYQGCVDALRRELGTAPEAETRRLYQELLRRSPESPGSPEMDSRRLRPTPRPEPALPDLPATATPLYGREAELTRLRQSLEDALAGRGTISTVVGEAGIGKTRLVSALAAEALTRGARVLIGHCHESDSILPFGPWIEACHGGLAGAEEEILGALHPNRRAELARLLPEAASDGVPVSNSGALPLFESVAQLVEQIALRQPLVLILEDLHWADEMSLRLLAFVGRKVSGWPALLVATAREEELGGASRALRTLDDLARPLVLAPLSRLDTAQLVRALAPAASEAPRVARVEERMWAMSEGNPLVVVEAMRALDQDRLWTEGDVDALTLPPRIRDLVGQRLDRLSDRGQELAAVAAVIGRRFDFSLLWAASGADERDVAKAVEEMVRQRVLQAVGDHFDFAHDRVREVAYERLLPHRRRLLHRAVADALEGLATVETASQDRLDEGIEQLAHHALLGESREKAVRYLHHAGAKATMRSALQSARSYYTQALGVLEALPESRWSLEEGFEIRLALRATLLQLGEFGQTLAILREAEALADRLDDDSRRCRVGAFVCSLRVRLEEPETARVAGLRALEIAERLGDPKLKSLATTYLLSAHFIFGEYERVVELATRNLAVPLPDSSGGFFGAIYSPAINDRFRLLVGLVHLGRFAEAAEHEKELMRRAEDTGQAYPVTLACHAVAVLRVARGDWEEALALIERQMAVLRSGNIVDELPPALAYAARALAYLGDTGEAAKRLREAELLVEEQLAKGRTGSQMVNYLIGRVHLTLGHLDEARRRLMSTVDAPGRIDFVPYSLHALGDLAVEPACFAPGDALAYYRQALALAEPRGMRPLIAHCHHGLGRLRARTGEPERAREHLCIAGSMYREMDMRFWLAEADADASGIEAAR